MGEDDTVVENFFALKVMSPIEQIQHCCFWDSFSMWFDVGGCGGAGLLGRHRHLPPLRHRGRGLEEYSHAQDPQQTPVQSVATLSNCPSV